MRGGSLFGAGSGTRSAILGQYRRQPGELKKYSLDTFCPSGRSLRVPLISYQPQKESVAEHELRIWCRKWDSNPHVVANNGF